MKMAVGARVIPATVVTAYLCCVAPTLAIEPAHLRPGGFYLTPILEVEQKHIDNLLRSANSEIDTWGTITRPSLQTWAQKDLDTYSLAYELEDGAYNDSSEDDYTNHTFRIDVHKEATARNVFDLYGKYFNGYEPRGTGLTEGITGDVIDKPLKYDLTLFGGIYTLGSSTSIARLEVEARTEEIKYKNFRAFTREYDRSEDSYRGTFFYRMGGRTDALLEVRHHDTDYRLDDGDRVLVANGLDSDEDIYLIGVQWEATAKTTGSIKMGAFDRVAENDERGDDNGFHWEAEIAWQPRTYSEFQLVTRRYSGETNGLGDYMDSREYSAAWNHSWTQRWHTSVQALFGDDNYPGSERQDERYEAEAGVAYSFRRWLDLGAGYRYEKRQSDIDALKYTRNVFYFDVKLSL